MKKSLLNYLPSKKATYTSVLFWGFYFIATVCFAQNIDIVKGSLRINKIEYDTLGTYKNNLCAIRIHGKWGFTDSEGNLIIQPQYDDDPLAVTNYYFYHNLAPVKKNGKWGYINKGGNVEIPFMYDEADPISSSGMGYGARVKKNGKVNYIDSYGKLILKEWVDDGSVFGIYLTVKKSGKYGIINQSGSAILPFEYDTIESSEFGGVSAGKKDNKYYIITTGGHVVDKPYDKVLIYKFCILAINGTNYDFYSLKDVRTILCDGGIELSETRSDQFFIYKNKGLVGLLDMKGNVIAEPIFAKIDRDEKGDFIASYQDSLISLTVPIDYSYNHASFLETINKKHKKASTNPIVGFLKWFFYDVYKEKWEASNSILGGILTLIGVFLIQLIIIIGPAIGIFSLIYALITEPITRFISSIHYDKVNKRWIKTAAVLNKNNTVDSTIGDNDSAFKTFYNETLTPIIEELKLFRKNKLWKYRLWTYIPLLIIIFSNIAGNVTGVKLVTSFGITALIIFFPIFKNIMKRTRKSREKGSYSYYCKEKIIPQITAFIDESISFQAEQPVDWVNLLEVVANPYFQVWDSRDFRKYKAGDLFTGNYKGINYKFTDYEGYLFFEADLNIQFSGCTRVDMLPDKFRMIDGKKTQMDNPQFEEFFDTTTDNPIEARIFLTPVMMQRMLEIKDMEFRNCHFKFEENKMQIALYYGKDLFEYSLFSKRDLEYNLQYYYYKSIVSLYNILTTMKINESLDYWKRKK